MTIPDQILGLVKELPADRQNRLLNEAKIASLEGAAPEGAWPPKSMGMYDSANANASAPEVIDASLARGFGRQL